MRVKKVTGINTWDLCEYFVYQFRHDGIDEIPYFFEGCPVGRMEILSSYLNVLDSNPPNFVVIIGEHDYKFGLSYGWEGATFHQHNAWQIDKWRQDISEAEFYTESDIFTHSQLTSVDEIAVAAKKQLDRLFTKLGHYMRTGLYQLEWEEMAQLMRVIHKRYQSATELHELLAGPDVDDYLGNMRSFLSGERQGSMQLELNGRFDEMPLSLKASRDQYGWRVDFFSPYSRSKPECPWIFCVLFGCEDRPNDDWRVRCPLPHSTPHVQDAKWIDVWDFERFLFEDYLPDVVEEISWSKRPPLSLFY